MDGERGVRTGVLGWMGFASSARAEQAAGPPVEWTMWSHTCRHKRGWICRQYPWRTSLRQVAAAAWW
jgi:hypothetical protein